MTKAVIFDMDGTLFQTDSILEISLEQAFKYLQSLGQWDQPIPLNLFRQIMGAPLPKVWETLLPNHSQHIRDDIDCFFLSQLLNNIHDGKGALYDNVTSVFTYLRSKNYSIFIASNGLPSYLQAIVSHYRLDQWISETFSIEQIVSYDKSDLVKVIADKYSITEGAVVGDRLSDIMAAKSNRLTAIGCKFDFAKEDELSHADIVIDDLKQLLTILT